MSAKVTAPTAGTHFGVALASAREVRMALQAAVRFGHRIAVAPAERVADHACRLPWGATH
jgi:hypothetical protein